MRLLFCCEFYYPSIGGVQEVMRQVAEHMVQRGHEIIVATTYQANRTFKKLNGVHIEEFRVSGNLARGMTGEVDCYREFVLNLNVDAILIKAAQQWTFDALWTVIEDISAKKIFIPCGLSGLYHKLYSNYFKQLPPILKKFDHLIFYSSSYRDIDYARAHGINNYSIISNGASEFEFAVERDIYFRIRHGISEESFLFLTVGSLTGIKGHLEVAKAFAELNTNGRPATLILNGNVPVAKRVASCVHCAGSVAEQIFSNQQGSDVAVTSRMRKKNNKMLEQIRNITTSINRLRESISIRGWTGFTEHIADFVAQRMENLPQGLRKYMPVYFMGPLKYWINRSNNQYPLKQVFLTDLPRDELVQAFKNSDLFVFASRIEYSPLVLFESAAAGTPFLSVPVGNAEEIAEWTGCGIICPGSVDENGYTKVNPKVLAVEMQKAMDSPQLLEELGNTGYSRWQEKFTWAEITKQYEKLLCESPKKPQ